MLYDNQEVLKYLNEQQGKLVQLFGDADAGRTQTVFSILNHLTEQNKLCAYWIPLKEEFRENVFQEAVRNKEYCIIGFPKTVSELRVFLKLADGVDTICIDNFLQYILHKQKQEIRAIFSLLSAAAFEYKTNFILVNDLRYYKEKGGLHPAYQEYFYYFCRKHIQVQKDSDFHISYAFVQVNR